jgi:hypothetical protein
MQVLLLRNVLRLTTILGGYGKGNQKDPSSVYSWSQLTILRIQSMKSPNQSASLRVTCKSLART